MLDLRLPTHTPSMRRATALLPPKKEENTSA